MGIQSIINKIDYPLHLGITEAGSFIPGSIKSSIGLGTLLLEGIGDTLEYHCQMIQLKK